MNAESTHVALDTTRPLTIAVLAMGGQGGGVLVDWIVALCEAQGWIAQSTSVPGVAQRTGATVYYIETLPLPADAPQGLRPVLSLMAVPGEIDIVIGTEFMEAGRAIQRGLVTPDRDDRRERIHLEVRNGSTRVVRVSSHYPFERVNPRLEFDRRRAAGA